MSHHSVPTALRHVRFAQPSEEALLDAADVEAVRVRDGDAPVLAHGEAELVAPIVLDAARRNHHGRGLARALLRGEVLGVDLLLGGGVARRRLGQEAVDARLHRGLEILERFGLQALADPPMHLIQLFYGGLGALAACLR